MQAGPSSKPLLLKKYYYIHVSKVWAHKSKRTAFFCIVDDTMMALV
jgi:hypothetical protein